MSSVIADSVLAATHKLVNQAMHGQWQDVPKTVEERRVLLDRLTASASSADVQWLTALRQAMAESDAAVASIAAANPSASSTLSSAASASSVDANGGASSIDATLDMIRKGR